MSRIHHAFGYLLGISAVSLTAACGDSTSTGGAPCSAASDCPASDIAACGATACEDGACVFASDGSAIPESEQTAGDCSSLVCDGNGDTRAEPDDLDLPSCYSGAEGTEGVGPCQAGTGTCSGGVPGDTCTGEVAPADETCATPDDDDCDGETNEEGTDCVCLPGLVGACPYSGPTGTIDVGPCKAATATCNGDGTDFVDVCVGEVLPNLDACYTAADEDCTGASPACTGTPVWNKFVQTTNYALRSATVLSDGGVVFSGFATNPAALDWGGGPFPTVTGSYANFAAKLDAGGTFEWARTFQSHNSPSQYGFAAAPAGDGGLILTGEADGFVPGSGPATRDLFVTKLTADGTTSWSKVFDGSGGPANGSIVKTFPGGLVLGGTAYGGIHLGGSYLTDTTGDSYQDLILAELDEDGGHVWSRRFDGYGATWTGLARDDAGNIYVSASGGSQINFGGTSLSSYPTVAKFDASGAHVWSKFLSPPGASPTVIEIGAGPAGVTLVGHFAGTVDFGGGPLVSSSSNYDLFYVRLDPAGAHVTSKRIGDSGAENLLGAGIDPYGGVTLFGTFNGFTNLDGSNQIYGADTGSDHFFAKLDASGSHLYGRAFPSLYSAAAGVIGLGADGSVAVGGGPHYTNSIDFGGGPLTPGGSGYYFAAKFAP